MWKRNTLPALMVLMLLAMGCQTTVTRVAGGMDAGMTDRSLAASLEKDLFQSFQWTAPPFVSRKIDFKDALARVPFGAAELAFTLENDGRLSLTVNGTSQAAVFAETNADRYYDLGVLTWKTVPREHLVTKYREEIERVAVTKYRTVNKTRSVYNSYAKRFETQYYTEQERYTDYENRSVRKPYLVWETVQDKVPDIPVYSACSFDLPDGDRIMIYKTDGGYFLQNVSFYSSLDKLPSLLGDVDVRIILIDRNSNGSYQDDDDVILYNTWNPFKKDAVYNELYAVAGNAWLDLKTLRDDRFLRYELDQAAKSLKLTNANSRYVKSQGRGTLTVSQLKPKENMLYLNGQAFRAPDSGQFKSAIEYGVYKLKIKRPGYEDYVTQFEVNEKNPAVAVAYADTPKAGTFAIKHDFQFWRMSAMDEKGAVVATVMNENDLSLPIGKYTILVIGGGYQFQKEVVLAAGESWVYDVSDDSMTKH